MTDQDIIKKLAEAYRPDIEWRHFDDFGGWYKNLNGMSSTWNPLENYEDLMPLVISEHIHMQIHCSNSMGEPDVWECYNGDNTMFSRDDSEEEFRRVACLALIKKAYPEETI